MNRIKSLVLIAGVVVAALVSAPVHAAQEKNLDFKLINSTGLGIDKVFLSPSSSEKWGEDVMGRDVLKNGESVDIKFHSSETECKWDLKVVDEEKDPIIWTGLNLCSTESIELVYKDHKPTAIIK